MGLKWFRARLTMNRPPKKSTTGVTGFYRSMSQFDSDVQLPQSSFYQEPHTSRIVQPLTTLPEPIAYNPMAGLNNSENKMSKIPTDIVSRPRKTLELDNEEQITVNKELDSPDDAVPRNLTRESIELMRDVSAEASPRRIESRSRKIDFKKNKKGRAPIPKMANSSAEAGERFVTIDKGRGSDASEIEI